MSHTLLSPGGAGVGRSALRAGEVVEGWGLWDSWEGDLQGEGPTDAWRVTGLLLEAGGSGVAPPDPATCQYVSSWAWGKPLPSSGLPLLVALLPSMPSLCSHLFTQGLHLEPVSARLADPRCSACVRQGWRELAHPQRSRPPTGLHLHLQNWT